MVSGTHPPDSAILKTGFHLKIQFGYSAFFWKGKGGKAKGSLLFNLEVVQIIVQNVGLWPRLLAEETGKYSL